MSKSIFTASTPHPDPPDAIQFSPSPCPPTPVYPSHDLSVSINALPYSELFLPGPPLPPCPNMDPCCNIAPPSTSSLPCVSSMLVKAAWAYHLRDYPDKKFVDSIMHIIDFGANIGFSGTHCEQSCCNLKSAIEFPESMSRAVTMLDMPLALSQLPHT